MQKISVYLTLDGKRRHIQYDAVGISAGTAEKLLGRSDCIGNGIAFSAPVIVIHLLDGEQATFDARHIEITF